MARVVGLLLVFRVFLPGGGAYQVSTGAFVRVQTAGGVTMADGRVSSVSLDSIVLGARDGAPTHAVSVDQLRTESLRLEIRSGSYAGAGLLIGGLAGAPLAPSSSEPSAA